MKTLKKLAPVIVGILIVTIIVIFLPPIANLVPKLANSVIPTKVYGTVIDLNSSLPLFPRDVQVNQPFTITGHLYFVDMEFLRENSDLIREGVMSIEDSWLPLPYRTVHINSGLASTQDIELTTDSNGFFSIEITIDNLNTWGGSVRVYYRGEERTTTNPYTHNVTLKTVYLYSSRSLPNTPDDLVAKAKDDEMWGNLSPVLDTGILVFVVLLLFLVYRYRKLIFKKKPTQNKVSSAGELITQVVPDLNDANGRINISFPQIDPQFPNVWGIAESLEILCQLKDVNRNPISNQSCVISPEVNTTIQVVTDHEGQVHVQHVFHSKCVSKLTVSFNDSEGPITGWRSIRIVDYREEVVNLLNRMIAELKIPGIKFSSEMTARELESILKTNLGALPNETIHKITDGFEEANYSLHTITRHSYVKMYLATQEVINHAKA